MTADATGNPVPDLTQGVTIDDFAGQRMLRGHVGDDAVMLVRLDDRIVAVGADCTHYSGPLDRGLIEGETVRCPLHRARFSLLTGEALEAPAFDSIGCWNVEEEDGRIFVRDRKAPVESDKASLTDGAPKKIVIIGGGAAGFAAAEMLRRKGYAGELTLLSDDTDAPYDRPNLSKDYLAGEAPEEWIPLRDDSFYTENNITLHLETEVSEIDSKAHQVLTKDGRSFAYDKLLLATGAEVIHLPIPGADQPHVLALRSLADSRKIIEKAEGAKSAVVLGSGFIGLETAAALRARELDVHVVSLDTNPLDRVLGDELARLVRSVHEDAGEVFHMETSITKIGTNSVKLSNETEIDADLVIMGVGVRPRVALASEAGLNSDKNGVVVNQFLETSSPDIYAAGDIARWPGGANGELMRVEHWVVAERQGQVAAENMLGARKAYRDVPFFWSAHHDITIRYIGHALSWDYIAIDGSVEGRDCCVSYQKHGKTVAMATIGRDHEGLEQALVMAEQGTTQE